MLRFKSIEQASSSKYSHSNFCASRLTLPAQVLIVLLTMFTSNASNACVNSNDTACAHATDQNTFLVKVKVTGKGKPIILSPGLMSNGSVYKELAVKLSKSYQLHIISVKGFAGTLHTGKLSLNQFVADIVAYIASVNMNMPKRYIRLNLPM